MKCLVDNVRDAVLRHRMLSPGQRVLAAVSGGPDSVAMLHVLAGLAPEFGLSLAVAHLDHGFREESVAEAAFVAKMAEKHGFPFVTERADLKTALKIRPANKQSAARDARYEFLYRAAAGLKADRIAVGHTADDQAETYIMREIRGSGARGLASIPPVRDKVVRPLIYATRKLVIEYLDDNGIKYVTDPTNLRPDYLRNSVRLRLMPMLKEYNPNIVETLGHCAEIMRAEDEFLDRYVADLLPGLVASNEGAVSLNIELFKDLPEAIKRRVMRHAICAVKGDLLGIGYAHLIDAAHSAVECATGRGYDLPGGVRVERSYGNMLVFLRDNRGEGLKFEEVLPVPGSVSIPELGIEVEATADGVKGADTGTATAVFDLEKMRGRLVVRNRRPGDFFFPVGMEGKKKLKKYFIDEKLPRSERAGTPLLDCEGQIAWVMGYRVDRRFSAGEGTKKPLLVRFHKAT
ncbi:MAG: tRNA lysidine(34) synthetase TilS [Nitrospirota bacterium]